MVSDLDVFANMQFGSYNRAMWPLHIKPAVSLPCFLIKFIPWLHHSYFLCCFLFLQTRTFYSLPHTLPTSLIPLSYAFLLTWIPWGKSPPPDCKHPLACSLWHIHLFIHSYIHSNPWFELLLIPKSLRHMSISPNCLEISCMCLFLYLKCTAVCCFPSWCSYLLGSLSLPIWPL